MPQKCRFPFRGDVLYLAYVPQYDATRRHNELCTGHIEHNASWWTCEFDATTHSFLFQVSKDQLEQIRVVGIDEIPAHAMLSNFTATQAISEDISKNISEWYTDVYVPDFDDAFVMGMHSALRMQDWERMHVNVGVVCSAGKCDPRVSMQRLNFWSEVHSNQNWLANAVCDAAGLHVTSTSQKASCYLENPLYALDHFCTVRVRVTGCDSVLRIDVTVLSQATMWECPWRQWFSTCSGACELCGRECDPGSRPKACAALSGTSECELCPASPANSSFIRRCEWHCTDGFWLSNGSCTACSFSQYTLGHRWVLCTHLQDGYCKPSAASVMVFGDDLCSTRCNDGFHRSERGMCEPCTTLHMLQQGVERNWHILQIRQLYQRQRCLI